MILFQVSRYRLANPDSLTLFLVYRGDHYFADPSKGIFLYLARQNSDLLYKLKKELMSLGFFTYVCSPRLTGSPHQTAPVLLSDP